MNIFQKSYYPKILATKEIQEKTVQMYV